MNLAESLTGLALDIARRPAAQLDVPATLSAVCTVLPRVLGLAGAVAVVAGPGTGVVASDADAHRVGELQRVAEAGPLVAAVRSGRELVTPDLTRVAPPELAAAAAQVGLTSAVTVPLRAQGRILGAVQLLGGPAPAGPAHVAAVRPVLDVLAARTLDGHAQRQLEGRIAALTAAIPVEQARGMLAERHSTNLEDALWLLRGQADGAGVPLVDAATGVLEGTDTPPAVPVQRVAVSAGRVANGGVSTGGRHRRPE